MEVYSYGGYTSYSDSDYAYVVKDGTSRKLKEFRGETAWSDADRWLDDKVVQEKYGK